MWLHYVIFMDLCYINGIRLCLQRYIMLTELHHINGSTLCQHIYAALAK